jgi:predicted Zn-dependent protease
MTLLMNNGTGGVDICPADWRGSCAVSSAASRAEPALKGLLSSELSKALAEVGFRAMATSHRAKSQLIFTTLRQLLPESECPVLGLALVALGDGDPQTAVTLLEGALAKTPDSLEMKAMLGRAFLAAGRPDQCALVLEKLACCDAQSSVGRYAKSLRDELLYLSGPAAVDWMRGI